MLCELCHKNEASGVLHRKDAQGEEEDLYVCKECLKSNNGKGKADEHDRKSKGQTTVTSDGEEPPAFIKNFLDAAVGLIEGVAGTGMPKVKKCPQCGYTWEKIKAERHVGCPDCWAQFGSEIRNEFLTGAYGPKHMGDIPEKTSDGKHSRAFLEKELKEAVARQNYRKAAMLRKELDSLDGGKEDGGTV